MIDHYSFGHLNVNGQSYAKDLIIYPDGRIEDSWWRKSGHRLCADDIRDLIESAPDLIIAGTGSPGLMVPDEALEELLAEKGIAFTAVPSKKVMKLYNTVYTRKKVGACFHLTC